MLSITDKATEKLKELLTKEDPCLRIFVQGGGCSGLQYGLMLEKEPVTNSDSIPDSVINLSGIKVLVDPISARYLEGAVIDFVDNLVGGGFQIKNPNAKSTCGCGSSFEPK